MWVHAHLRVEVAEVRLAMVMCLTRCANRPVALAPSADARMAVDALFMIEAFLACVLLDQRTLTVAGASVAAAALVMVQARHAYIFVGVAAFGLARLAVVVTILTELKLLLALKRAAIAPLCLLIAIVRKFHLERLAMLRIFASDAAVAHVAALLDIAVSAGALEVIAAHLVI